MKLLHCTKALRFALAALATTVTTSAFAADMAVKATPQPVAAAADWTGFYGDVGIGWQKDRFNWAYTNFAPAQAPFSLSKTAGSIAAHLGYQQQFSWLVVGAEFGVFQSTNPGASITSNGVAATGPCANIAGLTCSAAIASAATVGGKIGVDWGNWLAYGVGGDVFKANIATQLSGIASDIGQPNGTHGWYAGGGLDYLLYKGNPFDMIVGIEYEHVKLNTVSECSTANVFIAGGCPGTAGAAARNVSATENVVWAKLTLKFNPFH